MTFGNVLIPDPLPIVSSADSVANYPEMDRFLSDILHTAHLDSAEILFYAPHMLTMFVRPKGSMPPMRPSSVSSPMTDERPYTMWVNEGDIEDWTREPAEMYTYTYYDKGKKQLLNFLIAFKANHVIFLGSLHSQNAPAARWTAKKLLNILLLHRQSPFLKS